MVAKVVTTGHFIKAEDGQIYRLVGAPLDEEWEGYKVDKTGVEIVKLLLNLEGVEAGSAVWINKTDAEKILLQFNAPLGSGFDKDKDTP